ncbi:MAG TPA: FAD-binding oxidoreductase [Acidimicrobiia bacterium]|nr:FAD-binding oxidoreductase [Acidimicrobiia bacterium]
MEVVVVGGGIAGVSAGYYLAVAGCRVTLVEAEEVLAFHATGRSAALYFESYGVPAVRALTRASRPFFENPPPELAEVRFLEQRGALWIARRDQRPRLEAEFSVGSPTMEWLEPAKARALVPALKPAYLEAAIYEPEALDLDVAAIHQAFVRGLRRAGGTILLSSPLTALNRHGSQWEVVAGANTLSAEVVVNAAGAWGDEVAHLAGAAPLGLQPCRRTAFMVPGDPSYAPWPLVADIDNEFYFRPDGSQVLCSLADETPVPPGDARPEPADIALAIERINTATTLDIRTVRSSWAGLRTFTTDRNMVIGFDPHLPGLFWLVGQGGTGIQTAPAAGALSASLIAGTPPPPQLTAADLQAFAPDRFR